MNQSLLNEIIYSCEAFKIGKTAMELEERRSEPDYRDTYPNIVSVYESSNLILASKAEADLIDACINHPKCQNKKDGSESLNDRMGDGKNYQVYIVWR